MTQQGRLPIECLPDDTTGNTAYRVSVGCHNWQVCLASVCRMTQQASLPSKCLPEHTAGTSAYRVCAG